MKPHQEMHADGTTQGRDPRTMTPEQMEEIGLERISRGAAIRAKCIDCCGGNQAEVRRCGDVKCALWGFRMGTDPFREKRVMTEEQRAEARDRFARHREGDAKDE